LELPPVTDAQSTVKVGVSYQITKSEGEEITNEITNLTNQIATNHNNLGRHDITAHWSLLICSAGVIVFSIYKMLRRRNQIR
jgi:hypothetical protein